MPIGNAFGCPSDFESYALFLFQAVTYVTYPDLKMPFDLGLSDVGDVQIRSLATLDKDPSSFFRIAD
jgi:hypothetical protein